jgi:nitrite reductase/ring-hydroxylating ferredoxin subunit
MDHAKTVTRMGLADGVAMDATMEGRETVEYFAICPANDIDHGAARAFDLAEDCESGESRPFRILVARDGEGRFFAYRNACPHNGVWLNIGSGTFFDETGALLRCGRHGATFEIATGKCLSGPCEGARLTIVELAILDGDVCVHGVKLVEAEPPLVHDDDMDETMDIMIHPG